MTAIAITPPPNKPRRRSTAAIAGGVVLGTVAAIALSLGGLALWGDSRTDAAGYIHTDSERFATTTHALATDDLEIDDAGWLVDHDVLGRVRVRADAGNPKPVFVGI